MPLLSNRIIRKPLISQVRKVCLICENSTDEKEYPAPSSGTAGGITSHDPGSMPSANDEAEKILEKARVEAEEIYFQAKREGSLAGYRESLEKANQEAEEIRQKALHLLKEAHEVKRKTFEGMEDEIVLLSCEIAERIVNKQLTIEPETVYEIAKEAIGAVSDKEQVDLMVNAHDFDIFQKNREDILTRLPGGAKLNILTEPSIKQGGLKIRTSREEVDATIDNRWEVLKTNLVKGYTDV
ncbi:MAG: Flagellar assembly protein FliH/Type III secretion system HrpE [Desulfotomaculum sp. 46_296]|nr:MAG: Flagellar assembly protein FliH/Type III secretion system HrpE [Desulfotomaculum sp. 46_296]HAU32308.1 flagellar biosynthesis protein [Desulfotomaculum sp.]